jgi:periodic tryptophan protein 1
MITSLHWVPRGAARADPLRFELSPDEYKALKKLAKKDEKGKMRDAGELLDDAGDSSDEEEEDGEGGTGDAAVDEEFRMETYDDDDDDFGEDGLDTNDILGDEAVEIMEYGEHALGRRVDDDDDDDQDDEDDAINPTDSLLAVAITDEDYSHLEVQLFAEDGTLFVHHDIILPEMPLCLAWLDCPPFQQAGGAQTEVANYMAVGMMSPGIEIWNLDVLDPLEPTAVLGGKMKNKKGKKGKDKKKKGDSDLMPDSHEGAVMCLSWNKSYRQAIASGSADQSVKVWDVTTQGCYHTFTHHSDKVQAIEWHPTQAWMLATGSFDRTVAFVDCRASAAPVKVPVAADMEAMCWDPFDENRIFCTLENGVVTCIDIRNTSAPLFSFQAHDETSPSLSFSHKVPGMLATCSLDKTVKVWDTLGAVPKCVAYKSMSVGKLFSVQYYTDDPFLLAAGGDQGLVAIWESDELSQIKDYFQGRIVGDSAAHSGGFGASEPAVGSEEDVDMGMDMEMDVPVMEKKTKKAPKKKGPKK